MKLAKGWWWIVFSALFWSVEATILKFVSDDINAFGIILVQYAVVVLLTLLRVPTGFAQFRALPGRAQMAVAATGVMGVTAVWSFYSSFQYLPLSVASIGTRAIVIFVLLGAWLFLGEKLPRRKLPLVVVSMVSVFFVLFPQGIDLAFLEQKSSLIGAGLTLLASLLWTGCNLISRRFLADDSIAPDVFVLGRFGTALVCVGLAAVSFADVTLATTNVWPVLALVASASALTACGFWANYEGMKALPAQLVVLLEEILPVFVVLWAWLFLGENMTPMQWVAAAVLMISTTLLSMDRKE